MVRAEIPDYGYRSEAAAQAHTYLLPSLLEMLGKWDPPGSGLRLLDAGCGNGSMDGAFLAMGYAVVGVDASAEGIAVARAHHPAAEYRQVDLEADPAEDLGRFGAVVCAEVIEHVYAPRRLLAGLAARLEPGGILLVTTPYHGYLKNLGLALAGAWDQHHTVLWDGGHIKFWSRGTLEQAIRESGLEPIDFKGVGRAPFLWKSMVLVARKPGGGR